MRPRSAAAWTLVAATAYPAVGVGQESLPSGWEWGGVSAPFRATQAAATSKPAIATLLSLGLPGAGQHVLGQKRKWAYLAAEVLGWALYFERRGAGSEYRDRYASCARSTSPRNLTFPIPTTNSCATSRFSPASR